MNELIQEHYDKIISEYSIGDYYSVLLSAKDEYFDRVGKVDEEDDDYESRMSYFNDWYMTSFQLENESATIIESYLKNRQVGESIAEALLSINHSLFEYVGKNMKKCHVLNDILHKKKIILHKDCPEIALLKKDIFLGRVLKFDGSYDLLNGKCLLPKEIKSILKKQAKKVKKMDDPQKEVNYLLDIETLKTKWVRYGHVEPSQIFVFKKV